MILYKLISSVCRFCRALKAAGTVLFKDRLILRVLEQVQKEEKESAIINKNIKLIRFKIKKRQPRCTEEQKCFLNKEFSGCMQKDITYKKKQALSRKIDVTIRQINQWLLSRQITSGIQIRITRSQDIIIKNTLDFDENVPTSKVSFQRQLKFVSEKTLLSEAKIIKYFKRQLSLKGIRERKRKKTFWKEHLDTNV